MAKSNPNKSGFVGHHSLGLAATGILIVWIVAYCYSDPGTHLGSFFGNAIADWSGVVVMVFATKHLYEKGSSESRRPTGKLPPLMARLRDHSLSIFLLATGVLWIAIYVRVDSEGKWGQVVGNIVSEWTQIFGLVLLTKRLIELHSKESEH
jgi:peptidoglycan/LPS O-acetylase OafA/YrhL